MPQLINEKAAILVLMRQARQRNAAKKILFNEDMDRKARQLAEKEQAKKRRAELLEATSVDLLLGFSTMDEADDADRLEDQRLGKELETLHFDDDEDLPTTFHSGAKKGGKPVDWDDVLTSCALARLIQILVLCLSFV